MDYDTGLAGKPVGDHTPTLIGANGKNTPAPWVPYTRAGCDFGAVAAANTELENTLPDVPHVFGANSAGGQGSREPEPAEQGHGGLHGPVRALCAALGRLRRGVAARRAARRAGRLPRLPRAVREQVHPAVDQPGRAGPQPGRPGHQGLQRRHRVPRLRRHDRRQRARLHPGHADARRPCHLHLPVRPARQLQRVRRVRPRPGRVRQAAPGGERRVRHVLRPARRARHHPGQHPVRGHRGRGRPLRRQRADPGGLQRRDRALPLRQDRRGGRQPDRAARRQGHHHAVRRRGRLRARHLRARPAGPDGPRPCARWSRPPPG